MDRGHDRSDPRLELVRRLYDTRQKTRELLGSDYEASVETYKAVIRDRMQAFGCSAQDAAACLMLGADRWREMLLASAAIEVIENG